MLYLKKSFFYTLCQLSPPKKILPEHTKLQLFKTLILPILNYICIVHHCFNARGAGILNNHLQKQFNAGIRFVYILKASDHIKLYIIKSNVKFMYLVWFTKY